MSLIAHMLDEPSAVGFSVDAHEQYGPIQDTDCGEMRSISVRFGCDEPVVLRNGESAECAVGDDRVVTLPIAAKGRARGRDALLALAKAQGNGCERDETAPRWVPRASVVRTSSRHPRATNLHDSRRCASMVRTTHA